MRAVLMLRVVVQVPDVWAKERTEALTPSPIPSNAIDAGKRIFERWCAIPRIMESLLSAHSLTSLTNEMAMYSSGPLSTVVSPHRRLLSTLECAQAVRTKMRLRVAWQPSRECGWKAPERVVFAVLAGVVNAPWVLGRLPVAL